MKIHINYYRPEVVKLKSIDCPTCKRPTLFLYCHQEWYGPDWTCLRCGERFDEEGRAERPFEPRWRKKSIAGARKFYRQRGVQIPDLGELV